jgi:hypothetical protein
MIRQGRARPEEARMSRRSITRMLLAALLAAAGAASAVAGKFEPPSEQGINVVVQAVDEFWLPIQGAEVSVVAQTRTGEGFKSVTDEDGYAQFSVPPNLRYSIRASIWGFKPERVRSVRVWEKQRLYIQLKLKIEPPDEGP